MTEEKVKEKESIESFLERTDKIAIRLNNKIKGLMEIMRDPETTKLISDSYKKRLGVDEKTLDRNLKSAYEKLKLSFTMLGVTFIQLKEATETKKESHPIRQGDDLICNICGEPWDSWGVRHGDMSSDLDEEQFMKKVADRISEKMRRP